MSVNLLQLLRFIHILGGVVWVGTAVTLGFFVYPTLLTGASANGRLLREIMIQRKLAMFLSLMMFLVIASGLYLYRIDFPTMGDGHFDRRALDYTLGGFFGILAAIVGVTVNMPTGMKLGALIDSISGDSPTATQTGEVVRLSKKLLVATRSVAILLLGAAALMALARYAV